MKEAMLYNKEPNNNLLSNFICLVLVILSCCIIIIKIKQKCVKMYNPEIPEAQANGTQEERLRCNITELNTYCMYVFILGYVYCKGETQRS